jgi:hypothetical protein
LRVGDAAVAGIRVGAAAEDGGAAAAAGPAVAGAAGTADGRDCAAAAPVGLAGRVPGVDVVFAGLGRFTGFTDDGAPAAVSAGAELWPEPLLAGAGSLGGAAVGGATGCAAVAGAGSLGGAAVGGATGCAAAAGGTAAGVTSRSALGEGAFIEAQPETARITRNPVITDGCIDGSIGIPADPTPEHPAGTARPARGGRRLDPAAAITLGPDPRS